MPRKGYALSDPEARKFNRMSREFSRRGPPKARRSPRRRRYGGSNRPDPTVSTGHPWTIAEYDPVTGDILQRLDRGKRRSTSVLLRDTDLLFDTDGDGNEWLYVVGQGYINRDTGVLLKYGANNQEKQWESDAGAFSGPIFASAGGTTLSQRVCKSSDGYIWVLGTDTSNSCLGRFDSETGVQTHKLAIAVTPSLVNAVVALPSDGQVLVVIGSGGTNYIVDDTATIIHTLSGPLFRDFVINGSLIYATLSGTSRLKIYDFTLTELDSRAPPGSEVYGCLDTDGTTVWTTTSGGATPMIRAYDAANLATENWNAAQDAGVGTVRRLIHANSALYTFATHVRKHSVSDGSETWQSPVSGIAPGNTATQYRACAVSSGFLMVLTGDTAEQVFCLEESTGEVRWFDTHGGGGDPFAVEVTDDDRVFVCGVRVGP